LHAELDPIAPDARLQHLGRVDRNDPTVIDDRDPIAVLGLVHVVRREEDRDRLAAPKLLDVAPDVGSRLRIEAHGRFVEEQDPRGVQ